MRNLAQTLAQRAQCISCWASPTGRCAILTLMHDACRLLKGHPAGKPTTVVAAMIDVAIAGLYVDTLADGTPAKGLARAGTCRDSGTTPDP